MLSRHRRQLTEVQDKVLVYIRLQRFQAAEELLKTSLDEHGPLANLLNLMGLVHHRQSQFVQAIEYFEKARTANPRFVEASLNLAVTLSDLGFYDQSERLFHEIQALLSEGQNLPDLILGRLANLHNRTAHGYEQAGLLQEAATEYVKALNIFPRMPDIRLRLAKLYLRMGSYHQSQEQLHVLLEENPGHAECLNLLGTLAYRMGDVDAAFRFWQKTQNNHPHDKTSRTYLRSIQRPDLQTHP
ncbi:MAG: tetratricopeptide repeat protein [Oligoflexus sp.]|jgi:tetratricopeptide (TPR) repeat protein